MSGHRSNKSFKTHNRHMLDEHKLSVSSCLSNVTNPNQNNSCKITIFRAVHPHYHSPQHELILPLCFSPGRSRIALEWKAPNNATCSCLVSTNMSSEILALSIFNHCVFNLPDYFNGKTNVPSWSPQFLLRWLFVNFH